MQQTGTERVQEYVQLGGEGDSLGIVQAAKIWPYRQIVLSQTYAGPVSRV